MQRAPRDPHGGVITRRMWIGITTAAMVMRAATLLLLDAGLPGGLIDADGNVVHARTVAFHVLVVFQLVYAVCVRSEQSLFVRPFANPWLWLAIAAALALQAAVLYVPSLNSAFGTVPLSARDWAICAMIALTVAVSHEALKWRFRVADRAQASAA